MHTRIKESDFTFETQYLVDEFLYLGRAISEKRIESVQPPNFPFRC